MIRVRAPSRLHFGLLSLPPEPLPVAAAPSGPAVPVRHFGGVGLMVRAPGIQLSARPAPSWSAEGPLAERALAFAERFRQSLIAEALPSPGPHRLVVEHATPEHGGLGTGTQLGLAVASALAAACGLDCENPMALARRVGRGARSALGIHGFGQGGLLVEAGKTHHDAVAPLVARLAFPETWRVVLVFPRETPGLHGLGERQAFERLTTVATDALCRLVLLGLLPTAAEGDLAAFGEALYEFNRQVGEAFRPVQGGTYAHPRSAEIVAFARSLGVRGVGQSSWGPALFAVTADADHGANLATRLRQRFALGPDEVLVTAADNEGARVEA
jgi:beta-RFAP synthase